jgi:hypothetical protein
VLSYEFLIKFEERINWNLYFTYQEADYKIMKKFILNTSYEDLKRVKTDKINEKEMEKIEKIIKIKNLFVKGGH